MNTIYIREQFGLTTSSHKKYEDNEKKLYCLLPKKLKSTRNKTSKT